MPASPNRRRRRSRRAQTTASDCRRRRPSRTAGAIGCCVRLVSMRDDQAQVLLAAARKERTRRCPRTGRPRTAGARRISRIRCPIAGTQRLSAAARDTAKQTPDLRSLRTFGAVSRCHRNPVNDTHGERVGRGGRFGAFAVDACCQTETHIFFAFFIRPLRTRHRQSRHRHGDASCVARAK